MLLSKIKVQIYSNILLPMIYSTLWTIENPQHIEHKRKEALLLEWDAKCLLYHLKRLLLC